MIFVVPSFSPFSKFVDIGSKLFEAVNEIKTHFDGSFFVVMHFKGILMLYYIDSSMCTLSTQISNAKSKMPLGAISTRQR